MKQIQTDLRKFVAPEFVFGIGARHLAARYAVNFGGSRVLVVTDPGIIAAGWTKEVTDDLEAQGVPYYLFSAVTPNPKAEEVMAGAETYEREGCDMIVAVGGGSAIDCAKGIGIVSSNNGHILEYEGVDKIPTPGPPLVCVPTTSGSSADVSQFAIITDTNRKVKIAIISKSIVPDVSLVDPLTLTTLSPELTAYTGMDALVHAFEAFVSTAASPMTDLHALEAVRLLASSLITVSENPDDLEARSKTMLGSMYAGLAFSNASLGLVHAMAHSVGGYLDMRHGESNARLFCPVVDFNFESSSERYSELGEALGLPLSGLGEGQKKKLLLDALSDLGKALKTDMPLHHFGLKRTDIPRIAAQAMKDPCMATNPRKPGLREVEELYEQAF